MTPSLQDHPWEVSYKTSGTKPDGSPVDILHDFYIPALERSVRYDRVAGYFRSSSLAVASQGFSAFVAHEGRIRLIVGCDLDPADVAVVLNHGKIEETPVEEAMKGELTGDAAWPEDVCRGVELLGWLVQLGRLEIRVAFRVHKDTGKPIAADSTQDGYVHEKWALFHGFHDECLLIDGSLNESRQALQRNAENISLDCEWWSSKHKEAVEVGKHDFESLWRNDHQCFAVHTIPEAARQELLRLGNRITVPFEIDGTTAQPSPVEPPSLRERLQFALLRDAPKMPNGKFVGLYTSPVEPWPHQEVVAQRLIRSWPFNHLLCDEVGLGKTIEAGLAIRSLHLCGLAARVLIAAPASLCQQWQREMASKFLMPFARATSSENEWIFPEKRSTGTPGLFEENLTILSTSLLTRKERQVELKGAEPFDIALVDEAHYARRNNLRKDENERLNPKFNRLLATIDERLTEKTDCLWLATATPMQLDQIEIADLISVIGRVGSFQFDPSLTQGYYDILAKLVRGSDPTENEWEFLRRSIIALKNLDPPLWEYLDHTVVDAPIRSAVRRWIDRGHVPRGSDRTRIRRYVFAASPLARVMLRHTRKLLEVYRAKGELGANLARRTILPLPRITFTPQEKQAYEQLEEYCEGLKKQIEKNTRDSGKRVAMGFYLSFLRLRFASSLHAIRETVRRRRLRVLVTLDYLEREGEAAIGEDGWRHLLDSEEEREELGVIDSFLKDRSEADLRWELRQLETMTANLEDLSGLPSKMKELLRRIDTRHDKRTHRVKQMVIFSRFFDTVCAIRDRLRHEDPHMLIATYSGQRAGGQYVDPKTGQLVNVDRELVKHRFVRGEIDVLICTDAAAEGLNLQSADLLVNYDLPWNPMKVEQRIGRIDRIGQKHENIYVLNLAYPESAEEIVYDRLLNRLQSAGRIVGEQQFSLLPVTLDEFRDLAAGGLTSDELEAKATIRLEAQRTREQSTQIPADELHAIYHRLAADFRSLGRPATLAEIESALLGSDYLRRIGCVAAEEDGVGRWLTVNGLAGVPDGTRLSTSRDLYESGLADGTSVRFASYGDPVLHAIFDHILANDFPPCVRRLEVRPDDQTPPLVGYLVATAGEGLRLLRAFRDLERLTIDEDYTITDEEAAPFIRELEHDAAREWDLHRKGSTIEAINTKAAEAQESLNLMVARDLIMVKAKMSGETQFWTLASQLDKLANAREQLAISQLAPLSLLQSIEPDLLFEVTAPVMGDHGHMTAPRLLVRTAIDAACRVADSLNLKKGETTVDRVLGRIEREARKA